MYVRSMMPNFELSPHRMAIDILLSSLVFVRVGVSNLQSCLPHVFSVQ